MTEEQSRKRDERSATAPHPCAHHKQQGRRTNPATTTDPDTGRGHEHDATTGHKNTPRLHAQSTQTPTVHQTLHTTRYHTDGERTRTTPGRAKTDMSPNTQAELTPAKHKGQHKHARVDDTTYIPNTHANSTKIQATQAKQRRTQARTQSPGPQEHQGDQGSKPPMTPTRTACQARRKIHADTRFRRVSRKDPIKVEVRGRPRCCGDHIEDTSTSATTTRSVPRSSICTATTCVLPSCNYSTAGRDDHKQSDEAKFESQFDVESKILSMSAGCGPLSTGLLRVSAAPSKCHGVV